MAINLREQAVEAAFIGQMLDLHSMFQLQMSMEMSRYMIEAGKRRRA